MSEWVSTALLWIYAGGATMTALYLVYPYGPKLLRRLLSGRQRTRVDWVLLPLEVLVALLTGILAAGAAGALWPATVAYLLHERASQEKERMTWVTTFP
jgi:hypothetical protein